MIELMTKKKTRIKIKFNNLKEKQIELLVIMAEWIAMEIEKAFC